MLPPLRYLNSLEDYRCEIDADRVFARDEENIFGPALPRKDASVSLYSGVKSESRNRGSFLDPPGCNNRCIRGTKKGGKLP